MDKDKRKPDVQCEGCPLIARCSNDPSFQPPFFARCQQHRPKGKIDAKRLFERLIKIRLRMNEVFKDNQDFIVVVSKEEFDVLKEAFNSPENPDCNDPDFITLLAMRVTHWDNEK